MQTNEKQETKGYQYCIGLTVTFSMMRKTCAEYKVRIAPLKVPLLMHVHSEQSSSS